MKPSFRLARLALPVVAVIVSFSNGSGAFAVVAPRTPADYLQQINSRSRWPGGKCIRVYVESGRKTYPAMVSSCFSQWAKACGAKFSWTLVSNANQADYVIKWTTKTCQLPYGDEAGITSIDTSVNRGGLTETIERAQTRVLTWYEGRNLSDEEVAKTLLHEIGHGLGLEGHSSNPYDIMYYAASPQQVFALSPRDARTIARLYSY